MKRAFDATAWWASSGLMEFVRPEKGEPTNSAPGMGDHATSMSMFGAIAAALYRREKTGKGAYVSTSLVANGIWANGMALQGVMEGFNMSERKHSQGINNPFARIYRTRDGNWILFSIVNAQREWPNLARALGHSEWLEDVRFSDMNSLIQYRHELIELIDKAILTMDIETALRVLSDYEITHSHVKPMAQVVDDPQLAINGFIVDTDDDGPDFNRTIMSPVDISGESKVPPRRAPTVGQHTVEILKDYLELSAGQIHSLLDEGIVSSELSRDDT